jgi:uncharacterized protein (TIGR02453 family)
MFAPKALTFLRGLARNNDRDWFQARKDIFEVQLKAPMMELIEAVNAELMDFAPEHVTDPKKALYRIYRDTRFSADKTPYKTHVAAIFPRQGMEKHASASFYFQVSTKSVGIAGGVYRPGPDQMRAIRAWIDAHPVAFRKAIEGPVKLMGKLQGDAGTRMPKGFRADHPAADLLVMKQWLFWTELDVKIAAMPKLRQEIVKRFRAVAPVVEMLNAPLTRTRAASSLF